MGSCCVRQGAHLGTLWQPRRVEWGGGGREVQGGRGICLLESISHCCIAKISKILWSNYPSIKKKLKKFLPILLKLHPNLPQPVILSRTLTYSPLCWCFLFCDTSPCCQFYLYDVDFHLRLLMNIFIFSFSLYIYIYIYIYMSYLYWYMCT